MGDVMSIEILEDGTISVETNDISGKNHVSADEFLEMIEDLGGGSRATSPKKRSHSMALRSRDRKVTTFQK
jgi:hypothetical protein